VILVNYFIAIELYGFRPCWSRIEGLPIGGNSSMQGAINMNYLKILASTALVVGFAAPATFAASSTDAKDVQNAKMSLADAVKAAQEAESGSKAIYGKFHVTNGVGKYEIVVVNNGKTDTLVVDPTTGDAVKAKRDSADKTDKKGEATIESAQTTLAAAIDTAEKQGGRALEAELDTKKNTTAYEIEIANGDSTSTVWVDVNSGDIIKKS
jgi:uncharacterized membrane protein YkoI